MIDLHTFCVFFVGVIRTNLCALSVTSSGISRSESSSIKPFKNLKTSSAFSLFCLGTLSVLGRVCGRTVPTHHSVAGCLSFVVSVLLLAAEGVSCPGADTAF